MSIYKHLVTCVSIDGPTGRGGQYVEPVQRLAEGKSDENPWLSRGKSFQKNAISRYFFALNVSAGAYIWEREMRKWRTTSTSILPFAARQPFARLRGA